MSDDVDEFGTVQEVRGIQLKQSGGEGSDSSAELVQDHTQKSK